MPWCPKNERPPYVVWAHGGPAAHADRLLDLAKAYFTSRGIGIIDVNYGGSTGYGRTYRERLRHEWGVVDVEDVIAAAQALVEAGEADPARLAIRGFSAGGWTALAAVTTHAKEQVFKAAVVLLRHRRPARFRRQHPRLRIPLPRRPHRPPPRFPGPLRRTLPGRPRHQRTQPRSSSSKAKTTT